MKMVLTMLKILVLKLDITMFVMIMVLTWVKYGWMEMVSYNGVLAIIERLQKWSF